MPGCCSSSHFVSHFVCIIWNDRYYLQAPSSWTRLWHGPVPRHRGMLHRAGSCWQSLWYSHLLHKACREKHYDSFSGNSRGEQGQLGCRALGTDVISSGHLSDLHQVCVCEYCSLSQKNRSDNPQYCLGLINKQTQTHPHGIKAHTSDSLSSWAHPGSFGFGVSAEGVTGGLSRYDLSSGKGLQHTGWCGDRVRAQRRGKLRSNGDLLLMHFKFNKPSSLPNSLLDFSIHENKRVYNYLYGII